MKLCKPSWVKHESKAIFSVDIHPQGNRFATGGQGGSVVVWNLNSVLYEEVEMDPNVPQMLCQMDNHLACVNCVRWSKGGQYLASGGDDSLVMIWSLSETADSSGKVKSEIWRCSKILRGHAGDVFDLAWSPRDNWLASCSVDNSIIVWNAENFPEIVCVLNGHTGLVKGLAWDPVGTYLASQSDDKSLRVWSTEDWVSKTVITEPFKRCEGTTHALRLSWSPDGQYILSAHAMNGNGPTARVIERESWKCDKDFVGHLKAVTCVSFNSNIFVKNDVKHCCVAVGSKDKHLSIWLTSLKRPLVVIKNLFQASILDLSWSSDGYVLLACSTDGTVVSLQLTDDYLGTPLTIDEKNALYKKKYGKCFLNDSGVDTSNLLVEGPEILLAREKQEPKKELPKGEITARTEQLQQQQQLAHPPTLASGTPLRPIDRQIETRTSDGKRRITPVFIPLSIKDANESLVSQPAMESCFSTSSQNKSQIRVEKRDDIIIHPNVSNHATSITKNETGLDQRLRMRLPGPELEKLAVQPSVSPCPPAPPAAAAPAATAPAAPAALPAPALGTAGPVVRAAGSFRLQVVNQTSNMLYKTLSRLELIPNNSVSNDPVWETYLGSAVTCIACDARWACVACADAGLHAWRLARPPARALPHLALKSQAAKLSLSGDLLTVVTTGAELAMWDLSTASCVLQPLCFRNLVTHGLTVTHCSLVDNTNPMISLSNGKSYIYCQKLCAWIVWCTAGDPLRRAGGGALPLVPARPRSSPLHALPRGPSKPMSAATRSWLEAQVAACLHLRLAADYRHWLAVLFEHLLQHGTEGQLRNILDELLGPSGCLSINKKWPNTILGLKKHDLFEDMLAILVKQQRWQRLYIEYSEQFYKQDRAQGGGPPSSAPDMKGREGADGVPSKS